MKTPGHPKRTSTSRETSTFVEVLIVGAGFSGLGMGMQLKKSGMTSFLILEKGHDVGGTWRDNIYPGVACDIPSHLYSYSFQAKPDWSHHFADGPEIHQYLRDCAEQWDLSEHLHLNTEALEMRWNSKKHRWQVKTPQRLYECEILIMASGRLSEPGMPEITGLSDFQGATFHSARWNNDISLQGKRIGVIGTGASAIQIIPHLAHIAQKLVIFQRSAPYVMPRGDKQYSEAEKRTYQRIPSARERLRTRLFWQAEMGFAARANVPQYLERLRARALDHLHQQVPDAALCAKLTPAYEVGCKRILLSDTFYPALMSPNVTVEPAALHKVVGTAAVAANGAQHDLDVLIFATGFQSSRPPFAGRVLGLNGKSLSEHWKEGMKAHLSTVVSDFPNMFLINCPNASLGHNSAIFMIEAQIEYIKSVIAYRQESHSSVFSVRHAAEELYTGYIDRQAMSTVWTSGGCDSWYLDKANKRLTLLWPGFAYEFKERLALLNPDDFLWSPSKT